MIGFLKRDLSLQASNMRFYACFVAAFALLAVFTDFASAFVSLYLVIFSGTSIMSLFTYDEANRWEAYAAAAPGGRKAMVDARYLLSVGLGCVVFLLQLLLGILSRENQLGTALLYCGAFFLYAAILLPVSYRFGGTKSRVVMIVIVGLFSALIAVGATSLQIFSDGRTAASLGNFSILFPLAGAAALAISHRISRAIMDKKEL